MQGFQNQQFKLPKNKTFLVLTFTGEYLVLWCDSLNRECVMILSYLQGKHFSRYKMIAVCKKK